MKTEKQIKDDIKHYSEVYLSIRNILKIMIDTKNNYGEDYESVLMWEKITRQKLNELFNFKYI